MPANCAQPSREPTRCFSGDVNGDGKADFAITLKGHVSFHAGDILL